MFSPQRSELRLQLAVRAASEVAIVHNIQFDQAIVLQDVSNAIVRLEPTEIVARVATTTGTLRSGNAWFVKEVTIAKYLTAAGAPIIPVSGMIDPGPHEQLGLVMTFWQFVQVLPELGDAQEAGFKLRQCHEILRGFDQNLTILGLITEAQGLLNEWIDAGIFSNSDAEILIKIGDRSVDRLMQLPHQPIHGDPHLGNVLNTNLGLVWTDWEDAFMGPIEWDLASMVAAPRIFGDAGMRAELALQGYGREFNPVALAHCIEARTFVALIWGMILQTQHPQVDRQNRINGRLAWLRSLD
jgi:Phosphotransferase enzyme family